MSASPDLLLPLAAFAGTIFVGVVGHRVFERTGVPDVLALMALGAVMGPGLHLFDVEPLRRAAPIIGTFALLVILLEGGLELNYRHIVRKARATTVLTLANLGITTLAVAVIAEAVGLGFWPGGVLLGIVVAPLSASVLVPMLARLRVQDTTRTILGLECTVGEALAAVGLFALVEVATSTDGIEVPVIASQITTTFAVGVALAVVGGLLWLELLRLLGRTPYSYMLTLAAAVALFAAIEGLGGNGFVGTLVFGLMLSNAREISAHLPEKLRTEVVLDDAVRWMNTEVTFFVRTFFFVYLGLILDPAAFGPDRLLFAALLLAAIIVARVLAVQLLVMLRPAEREDRDALVVLLPRGLATAVLAALTGSALFIELASVLIVATNLAMTVGLVALHRRVPPGEPPRPDAPPSPAGPTGMDAGL